jgi:putative addiction module component (TIGR02574 family)
MGNAALNKIRTEALGLAEEDRAVLAHDLLNSLDGSVDGNAAQAEAWDAEIERRLREVETGTAPTISAEESLRRIRRRLEAGK